MSHMLYQKWEGSLFFYTKQNKYNLKFPLIYKMRCKIISFSMKDIWKYKKMQSTQRHYNIKLFALLERYIF